MVALGDGPRRFGGLDQFDRPDFELESGFLFESGEFGFDAALFLGSGLVAVDAAPTSPTRVLAALGRVVRQDWLDLERHAEARWPCGWRVTPLTGAQGRQGQPASREHANAQEEVAPADRQEGGN